MHHYPTTGRKVFLAVNSVFLLVVALLCLLPIINILAVSLSSSAAAATGKVGLWPIDFTISSYKFVGGRHEFFTSFFISVKRVLIGVPINMLLTILIAYPLSKEAARFRLRGVFVWFFLITILFNGGLIPWYMTIKQTGILDSIWALILPGAVPVFNCILLLNFFRELPKELEEAAIMDGAGHWTTLWKLFVPISVPAIATLTLFSIVGHWNSWFDGLILMNKPQDYPLQSYLQTVIVKFDSTLLNSVSSDQVKMLSQISNKTTQAAQIFIAALPILIVYPLLQRYFISGIVLGSVKG
ncbi:carbohydrate ABC transporter permease [Paenibacillus spongiae]|uniref:Carbohydrate ABC transporter permease n=1 Tax=Paenibacillus spongiae TaxID=2909671 RepID=A0ABY5S9P1_9BACL|nr:carbohydrate ABC transporter permease [Paenibacillus spongiae]UVI29433.1 carbohydrate ABC transporter permease [Paenibacillus spongiae]